MLTRACEACGREFTARRRDARFCGSTCRGRARRRTLHRAALAPAVDLVGGYDATEFVEPVATPSAALAMLDALLEQLAADVGILAENWPADDPDLVMVDTISWLATHLARLTELRRWLASGPPGVGQRRVSEDRRDPSSRPPHTHEGETP